MRLTFAIVLTMLAGSAIGPAHADPYRWCAVMGNSDELGTGCGYLTLAQCQASISGNGGFCTPNNFYDGRPVTTPEDGVRTSRKRSSRR